MRWLIVWLLFAVVVIYNALDSWQTILLLSLGAREANPIVAWFIGRFETVHCIWFVKAAPITMLAFLLIKKQTGGCNEKK